MRAWAALSVTMACHTQPQRDTPLILQVARTVRSDRYRTRSVTSLEGPLVPHAFFARTLTWYVRGPTFEALSEGVGLPVSLTTRSDAPGAEPASMTYDV